MTIKTLGFRNFLRFFEQSELNLEGSSSGDSSLTLALAPNDAGKTSVMRGLEFLFYGEVEGKGGESTLADLVNNEAFRLAKGKSVNGFVEAILQSGGHTIAVRREISAGSGSSNQRRLVSHSLLHLVGPEGREKWVPDHDGVIAHQLQRLVPRSLFDYFFFKGEELANALIEKQDPQIKEGLAELLHEDDWEVAISDLEALIRKLNLECKEASGKDDVLEAAVESFTMAEERESKLKKDLERAEKQYQLAEEDVGNLTRRISESVGKVDEAAAKQLAKTQAALRDHNQRLDAAEQGLLSGIGATRGLPFLKQAFHPVREILGDLREKNLLPADVSEGFIGRVLEKGVCMCGCELSKGSKHRDAVEKFRAYSLSAELNNDLFNLYNLLEADSAKGFENDIEQSLKSLDKSVEFMADERSTIKKLETEEQALKARVDEAAQKRCNDLLMEQHKAIRHQTDQRANVQEIRMRLQGATNQKEQLRKELNSARLKTKNKGNEKVFAVRDLASSVLEVLEAGLQGLKGSLHEPLERTVSDLYDPVTKDGSEAKISPSTLLPYIQKAGKRATFLGGGQKQVLCLSYIIALAQLRRDLNDSLRAMKIMVPKADDQIFVMDSIFGQCEPEYQEAICKFLPRKSGQTLLLLARQQWSETVRANLETQVSSLFGFEYHSPNSSYDETKHQFPFRQKNHRLLRQAKDGQTAFTVIHKLTI
jgi:DNA sulfur modification protein DndD